MGNGKKARFEKIQRPQGPDSKPAMTLAAKKAQEAKDAERLEDDIPGRFPESFVVVLAYNRTEEDTSEEFAKLVEDFKALFSLREGHRVYALVDEAASEVLSIIEKTEGE